MSAREIWVIEDNDLNFDLVEFLLAEAGFAVRRAADSDAFRRLLGEPPPALVLLDMNIAGVSGLDLLAALRADSGFAAVPVVALTAHAMRGDRERFLAAGCAGYIAKPIASTEFVGQVRGFLAGG